jgi:cellulose synthase/poly-beta-1,6-N-acetylglucosamine synthase-like glycosyltransferase
VVVAALDEESVIGQKIADTRAQDYPADRLEVVVVADGSTDATADIARAHGVTLLLGGEARGKSAAVNSGVAVATGEVVCLTDANLRAVAGSAASARRAVRGPRVAVVSGARSWSATGARGSGEGLYWRLESFLKAGESTFGVTMGAPGEICGLRRSTFRPIPPNVINDDYHLTCDALVRGWHVAYAPHARALENRIGRHCGRVGAPYAHRGRHVADDDDAPAAGGPRAGGWTAVAFVSHRVLRSLVVPPLLRRSS